jgi:hypothetical protein
MIRKAAFFVLGCLLVSLLSGCALTPEEKQRRAERRLLEERRKAEAIRKAEENRLAGLRDQCKTYGFAEGTTPMAQCVMNLDNAFKTRDAQRAAEAAQGANCTRQMLLAFGAPTRTGSLAEATANGNRAYQECMGSQPPPQPAAQRVCVPTMNPSPTGGTVMVCTN